MATKCEVCGEGPPVGPSVYRVNKPGEMPAHWRCKRHLNPMQYDAVDETVMEITEVLERGDGANTRR